MKTLREKQQKFRENILCVLRPMNPSVFAVFNSLQKENGKKLGVKIKRLMGFSAKVELNFAKYTSLLYWSSQVWNQLCVQSTLVSLLLILLVLCTQTDNQANQTCSSSSTVFVIWQLFSKINTQTTILKVIYTSQVAGSCHVTQPQDSQSFHVQVGHK